MVMVMYFILVLLLYAFLCISYSLLLEHTRLVNGLFSLIVRICMLSKDNDESFVNTR